MCLLCAYWNSESTRGSKLATVNISKRSVDALKPTEKDAYLWDNRLAGFGVKCTPTGHKVYLAQYRTGGRGSPTRRITLGRHGTLTPDQARLAAERALAGVRLGRDPAGDRAWKRKESTIAELAQRYLEEHVAVHNRPSMAKEARRLVERHIKPGLGKFKVSELSRAQIKAWHHALCKTPYEANRALACLSKILSLASTEWELRTDNPCIGIKRFPEIKREAYYKDAELKCIGEALAEAEQTGTELPGIINVVRLLALTGCRLGEIRNLKWTDVDLECGLLNLSDAKTGARTVAMGAPVTALLVGLNRGGEYVCSGKNPAEPLTTDQIQNTWKRLRKKAGIPRGRLHDFRHTTGTYAAQAGLSAFIVRDLLGHKTMAMTGRYVEKATDPLRVAANAVSGRVAVAMRAGNGGAEVIELGSSLAKLAPFRS